MPSETEWRNCTQGMHLNEGDDVCAVCGEDLNPPLPTWEQRLKWRKAVAEDRTEMGLYEWINERYDEED